LHDTLLKYKLKHDYPTASKVEVPKSANPQQQTGPPPYVALTFEVHVTAGKLKDIVGFLVEFENTPLLQRIKKLDIVPGPRDTDLLAAKIAIEALVVQGNKRPRTLVGVDHHLSAVEGIAATMRRGPGITSLVLWAAGPTGPKAPPPLRDKPNPRPDADYLA